VEQAVSMETVIALALTPLVAALLIASIREPLRVALPLFAALVPVGHGLSLGSSPFTSLSSLAGMLLGGALVVRFLTGGRTVSRIPRDVPVWLIFLGIAVASSHWTVDRSVTFQGLAVLASLVLVYVLVSLSPVDATAVRRTENALVVGGVGVVLYGLYQLTVLGGFPEQGSRADPAAVGRFGNDLLDPNLEAVALTLPLVVALSRAFAGGAQLDTRRRLVNGVAVLLILLGIVMTASRTGLIAAGVATITLAIFGTPTSRGRLLAFAAVAVTTASLVFVYHPFGIAQRTFESVTSPSGRTDIWRVGLTACSDYCSLGSGWGTFPIIYARTHATVSEARVLVGGGDYQPHNLWLLAAVEIGVLGLLVLLCALAASAIEAWQIRVERRGVALGALAGLVSALSFLSSMEFKFFWMVLMMVALYRNLDLTEESAVAPPAVRVPRAP
jgi:O-antigen ligase